MAASQVEHIAWLGEADGGIDALGGKAASLDRLIRIGLPVPPAFCVTTAAFHAAGGVRLTPGLRAAIDVSTARLSALVADLGLADAPRFAVRSSAIGEDGFVDSYAGLHETELGVPPPGVADAVERCWASLASPAAVAYRQRKGISGERAAMAVAVQALVAADAAAVAFTIHPVTGRTDQLVVTAVRGLGDVMVSGEVTPDTWIIDRASRAVVEFSAGEPEVSGAVDERALAELVNLSLEVEQRLGDNVDVEAARRGRWYLLQARPVTARMWSGAVA